MPASAWARRSSDSGTLPSSGTSELIGQELAAALAEDREALAVGSREGRHVLDHAEHLEIDLRGHLGGSAGDRLGGGLRRRDDRDLGLRKELGERHRDVAGARRQVEQKEVERAPVHVLEELLDRLVEHGAAPDDGGVLLDEEADRHHLDAGGPLERDDLALLVHVRAAVDAEHARDRVAVDVAVERADGAAFGGERGGEVGGHRRLADSALARGDADHVLHLRERALRKLVAAERLLEVRALLVGEDVELDRDGGDALDLADVLGDRVDEVGADRAARGGRARRSRRPGRRRRYRSRAPSPARRCSCGARGR